MMQKAHDCDLQFLAELVSVTRLIRLVVYTIPIINYFTSSIWFAKGERRAESL
jgi:hypothetical protein